MSHLGPWWLNDVFRYIDYCSVHDRFLYLPNLNSPGAMTFGTHLDLALGAGNHLWRQRVFPSRQAYILSSIFPMEVAELCFVSWLERINLLPRGLSVSNHGLGHSRVLFIKEALLTGCWAEILIAFLWTINTSPFMMCCAAMERVKRLEDINSSQDWGANVLLVA